MLEFGNTNDSQPPWKLTWPPPPSGVYLVLPAVLAFGSLSVMGHTITDQQHLKQSPILLVSHGWRAGHRLGGCWLPSGPLWFHVCNSLGFLFSCPNVLLPHVLVRAWLNQEEMGAGPYPGKRLIVRGTYLTAASTPATGLIVSTT